MRLARTVFLSSLLTAAPAALAQATPSTTPQPAAPQGTARAEVAPDAPVITIQGICAQPAPAAAAGAAPNCVTTVTRAQLERLAQALDPNLPRSMYAQVADTYARSLIVAQAA